MGEMWRASRAVAGPGCIDSDGKYHCDDDWSRAWAARRMDASGPEMSEKQSLPGSPVG